MRSRHLTRRLGPLLLVGTVLVTAACGDEAPDRPESVSRSSTPTATSTTPPATVEGLEDEVPPADAGFPASIADDGGDPRAGAAPDTVGQMAVTGVRVLPQNGYVRVIVDLDTNGIPFWTARYTEASTGVGDPVDVAGDSFLRLGLFTENSSAEPLPVVAGDGGLVTEVHTTGSVAGYQEVLIGLQGEPAPFRTFGITDPGRIVVDIRPAG